MRKLAPSNPFAGRTRHVRGRRTRDGRRTPRFRQRQKHLRLKHDANQRSSVFNVVGLHRVHVAAGGEMAGPIERVGADMPGACGPELPDSSSRRLIVGSSREPRSRTARIAASDASSASVTSSAAACIAPSPFPSPSHVKHRARARHRGLCQHVPNRVEHRTILAIRQHNTSGGRLRGLKKLSRRVFLRLRP